MLCSASSLVLLLWSPLLWFFFFWPMSIVFWGVGESFPDSSVGKEFTCNAGDPGSVPDSGRIAREGIGYPLQYSWISLVAQLMKNPPGMPETWVGKIPWRKERLPTPVFWPGELHGLYSPWCCKESDMSEWLSLSLFFPPLELSLHFYVFVEQFYLNSSPGFFSWATDLYVFLLIMSLRHLEGTQTECVWSWTHHLYFRKPGHLPSSILVLSSS